MLKRLAASILLGDLVAPFIKSHSDLCTSLRLSYLHLLANIASSVSLNIFYSTISYIYIHAIYIINRIRTEASAYLVLLLLMDKVSQIMAAKTVCYCC